MSPSSGRGPRTQGEAWMTLFHTTMQSFNKVAQKEIVKAFQAAPNCTWSKIIFDEDAKIWEVTCLAASADEQLKLLENIIEDHIHRTAEQTNADSQDVKEVPFSAELDLDLDLEDQLEALLLDDNDKAALTAKNERIPVREWSPLPNTNLSKLATPELLREVEVVTDCELSMDEIARRILIFNVDEGEAEIICQRLENLQNDFVRRPIIQHMLNSKRGEGFRLKFQILRDLDDDLLSRVLLPPPSLFADTMEDRGRSLARSSVLWHYTFDPVTGVKSPNRQTFRPLDQNSTNPPQDIWQELSWVAAIGQVPPKFVEDPPELAAAILTAASVPISTAELSIPHTSRRKNDVESWMATVETPTEEGPMDPIPGSAQSSLSPRTLAGSATGSSITDVSLRSRNDPRTPRFTDSRSTSAQSTWQNPAGAGAHGPHDTSAWPVVAERNTEAAWGQAVPGMPAAAPATVSTPSIRGHPSRSFSLVASRGPDNSTHVWPQLPVPTRAQSHQAQHTSKQPISPPVPNTTHQTRGSQPTHPWAGAQRSDAAVSPMHRNRQKSKNRQKAPVPTSRGGRGSYGGRGGGQPSRSSPQKTQVKGKANIAGTNRFALIDVSPEDADSTSDSQASLPPGFGSAFDLIEPIQVTSVISSTVVASNNSEHIPLPPPAPSRQSHRVEETASRGTHQDESSVAAIRQDPDAVVERVADSDDEEDRRKVFYRTMRQKKPSPSKKAKAGKGNNAQAALDFLKQELQNENAKQTAHTSKLLDASTPSFVPTQLPLPLNVRTVQACFLARHVRAVLVSSKCFRGKIRMEMQIGQIIVPNISSAAAIDYFSGDLLENKLCNMNQKGFDKMFDAFTNIITSSFSDSVHIPGLLMLKADGQRATWEIICQQSNGEETRIYVDAMGSMPESQPYAEIGELRVLGAVYYHTPHHVYDSRFVTLGARVAPLDSIEGAQELVDTLYVRVPDTSSVPELQARDGLGGLHVAAIRLRTTIICNGPIVAASSSRYQLQITRVQDYAIERPLSKNPANRGIFRGYFDIDKTDRKADAMWYEISLCDANPSAELSTNTKLGPGQVATWDIEDAVADDAFYREIANAAAKLVERMDGVGRKNRGPGAEQWQSIVQKRKNREEKEAEKERMARSGQPMW